MVVVPGDSATHTARLYRAEKQAINQAARWIASFGRGNKANKLDTVPHSIPHSLVERVVASEKLTR